ncbi:MAG: LptE family protein [Terriglobia bacterium]
MRSLRRAQEPAFCAGLISFACIFCAVWIGACGYQVGGRGALIPPDIKTIAIPAFTNQTAQFRIEQQMTEAVTRQLIERTKYRVTQDPAHADAVLQGTVESVRQGVVTFNPQSGSASTLQVQVVAAVKLVDLHTKKVVFSNPRYVFRDQYQVSPTASTLIEEDPAALNRLSQDFARSLVTDILENF